MEVSVPMTHNWAADQWDWPLQNHDGILKVHHTPDKFEVAMSAAYFSPDEIKISTLGHDLVVYAKHEARSDQHGTVSREIHRVYKLPQDVDPSTLKSHLANNGTLVISANVKK